MSRSRFNEPYPTYRSLRVPIWENETLVRVRRLTQQDVDDFAKALEILKGVLNDLVKSTFLEGCNICEKLERVANTITLFYKAPLIIEVSPVAPSPLKAFSLLLLLESGVLGYEFELGKAVGNPLELAKAIAGKTFAEILKSTPLNKLFSKEVSDLVYKLWIAFPADTRPGYNTSSLVLHLLLTSAIAWALNYPLYANKCEMSVLRIAALLHDIGKAVDPENHVEASVKLAKELLKDVVPEVYLDKVLQYIREHHVPSSTIHLADALVSETDRLEHLVDRVLGDKLKKLEEAVGASRYEWKFYKELYRRVKELEESGLVKTDDPVKELSEEFLEKVKTAGGVVSEDRRIRVMLVDLASIQDFVCRAQDLKAITVASTVVDLVTHVGFYFYLVSKVGVPPEAIVYSGGGNMLLLLPANIDVDKLVEEYNRCLKESDLPLSVNYSVDYFKSDYTVLSKNLGKALAKQKFSVKLYESLKDVVVPIHNIKPSATTKIELCRLCYSSVATERLSTPEGDIAVCKLCKDLYEIGLNIHFASKWSSILEIDDHKFSAHDAFGREWGEVSRWTMEVIAGHDPEELERGVERLRDYAVVKFDGNNIGFFMLDSISFTEAVEKSFRVDMAIKRSYLKALELVFEGIKSVAGENRAKREVARIFLGTVYMGGDDGLLIVPAYVAIPLAHFIAEKFSRELGTTAGLTVAVTGGHAKMNIWALVDSADSLLNSAKKYLRTVGGGVIFDLYEGLAPSGREASRRVVEASVKLGGKARKEYGVVDSNQPYEIRLDESAAKKCPEIWRTLLPLVLGLDVEAISRAEWLEANSSHYFKEVFATCFLASRAEDGGDLGKRAGEVKEHIRLLRRALLNSLREVSGYAHKKELLYIYLAKQARGEGAEVLKPYYEKLLKFLGKVLFTSSGVFREDASTGLLDIFTLIKFVKGGAW